MILRSKIMKNTSVSREYFAAAGGKRLSTQPRIPNKILRGEAADTLINSCHILKAVGKLIANMRVDFWLILSAHFR
jgi:hypothetical protein